MPLNIRVEFGGGLELLFGGERVHNIVLASGSSSASAPEPIPIPIPVEDGDIAEPTLSDLINHLRDNLLTERVELFVDPVSGDVRPGILVLVNDTDWELEGEGAYVLKDKDEIVFISTLHGG